MGSRGGERGGLVWARLGVFMVVAVALGQGCTSPPPPAPVIDPVALERSAAATLDQFHAAAAKADGETYFGLFAEGGVFLGTDRTERWSVEKFRAYAEPHFSAGRGWTYTSKERHIKLSADGEVAWFDERLDHADFGELRGSGVLIRKGGAWSVAQYVLSFPVPNDVARQVIDIIKAAPPINPPSP